jgi:hypothetical protein
VKKQSVRNCDSLAVFFKGYLDVHDNNLRGTMPKEICDMKLDELVADCHGRNPEVKCTCCTICCEGLPSMVCVDQKTGRAVDRLF